MFRPNSNISDLVWPSIPDQQAAIMLGLQFQFEQSQWRNREEIRWLQFRQLESLIGHAVETVPYYREILGDVVDFGSPLTMESWTKLPILERQTIHKRSDELQSSRVPETHGGTFQKKTSGSTGRQMNITDTEVNNLYWMATTLRDHLWHGRNLSGGFVSIRSGRSGKDPNTVKDAPTWGVSTGTVYPSGPSTVFYHTMDLSRQAEILEHRKPEYLQIYPSNALRLAEYFREKELSLPSLREVITYGELLLPEVCEVCHQVWNVPVTDMYSCEEVGYIALQCPEFGNYHCQSESVLVEVINDEGQPCKPGEVGKIVLTSLHNFAMPFIRYENLDYAEVGPPCACGRGSMVLSRLLGRERNMAVAIDGTKFWPNLSRDMWSRVDGVEELQLIQQSANKIDVRVVAADLGPARQQMLAEHLRDALEQPYDFSFQYQDNIIRHANGKYERFVCNVDD